MRVERTSFPPRARTAGLAACLALALCGSALGAGILTPVESGRQPIEIRDHHVKVTINNGFSMTEVTQTFFNPNPADLEAVYSFPVPRSASLSEVTIQAGDEEIHGEVLARERAREIYEQERSCGGEAGLAGKQEFYTFDFRVDPVRVGGETRIRFLYYQPVEIDTGVGRYVYPLEEAGPTSRRGASGTTIRASSGASASTSSSTPPGP